MDFLVFLEGRRRQNNILRQVLVSPVFRPHLFPGEPSVDFVRRV